MNRGFVDQRRHPFQRFLESHLMDNEGFEMFKDIISFGCMCSTALASPILFEFQTIWFM